MANLIPVIAKELGVEIGEEFKLDGLKYRFTDAQLEVLSYPTKTWVMSTINFNHLNTSKVIKLPFTPKHNESYWSYFGGVSWHIACTRWTDDSTDLCRKACGCVFRTRDEAIKSRPSRYKELTGKDWEGEQ